jgi:hypothetical protein
VRGDGPDELTCASQRHRRNLDPAKALFKVAG